MSRATAGTFNDKAWVQWVGLAFRLILGGLFVYAGFIKLLHLPAAKRDVVAYQLLPHSMAEIAGVALPILEVSLGLLLIFGLFTRIASVFLTLLLVIYIAAIVSVWARHMIIACNCTTTGRIVTEWPDALRGYKKDIVRDVLLVLAATWLYFFPRTVLSVDGWLKGPKVDYDALDTAADDAEDLDEAAASS